MADGPRGGPVGRPKQTADRVGIIMPEEGDLIINNTGGTNKNSRKREGRIAGNWNGGKIKIKRVRG